MDLVGEMLAENLSRQHPGQFHVKLVRPGFLPRFTRIASTGRWGFNADRLLNRMLDYPRYLARLRSNYDLFHVIDHTYAHLVHGLPPGVTAVTCHDLDAFRSILQPAHRPHSPLRRVMARRILSGMRKAAKVICVSDATRNEVMGHRLISPQNLVTIHNGVHPAMRACDDPAAEAEVARWLGPAVPGKIQLLHVGSVIPRKGIDVLLRVVAGVREKVPDLRLVQVGGRLTPAQDRLARQLGMTGAIAVLPRLTANTLAAVYRRCALTLLTSSAEGFGLPVAESMACGTPVVASDLAATREVGGDAASYCPVGDVPLWVERISALLREREIDGARWTRRCAEAIARAGCFSWERNAALTGGVYREIAAAAAVY